MEDGIGFGATLAAGDGADPEVFTAVAGITQITPPQLSVDSVETTKLKQTDRGKTFIAGLVDAGEVSFEASLLLDATQTALHDDLVAGTTHNWQITFADGSTILFSGHVSQWQPGDITDDGKLTIKGAIKVSGLPTVTPAA